MSLLFDCKKEGVRSRDLERRVCERFQKASQRPPSPGNKNSGNVEKSTSWQQTAAINKTEPLELIQCKAIQGQVFMPSPGREILKISEQMPKVWPL